VIGANVKEIDGYRIWYSGFNRAKNGVDILAKKELVEQVVEVRQRSNRIISFKLVVGAETINIVNVYALQIG